MKIELGKSISSDSNPKRDAVHVAVVAVFAYPRMKPGDRVAVDKIVDGEMYVKPSLDPIGVIDPFLDPYLSKEIQKCWMLVYPNTVVNLRHDWDHDLLDIAAADCDQRGNYYVESIQKIRLGQSMPNIADPDVNPRTWIMQFAKMLGMSHEKLASGVKNWLECGEEIEISNASHVQVNSHDWEQFWSCYEALTGAIVPKKSRSYGNFFYDPEEGECSGC